MKILANDGISKSGQNALEQAGFDVITTTVAQEQLEKYINENNIDAILVRSATKVRQSLIDACSSIKLIGRGGVGMDNIDVEYAKSKGIHVINTPAASSLSVAELVFAHLFGGVRYLYDANRNMPLDGDTKFKALKKGYTGSELRGKTLGVIGFGRIGKEVAKIGLGIGMNVITSTRNEDCQEDITLEFHSGQSITIKIDRKSLETVLKESDFITFHIPAQKGYVIGKSQFEMMKNGVGIINAARGGVIDEKALLDALETGKVSFAGLDVFENEPAPAVKVLMNGNISLSPHIGGSTSEAQDRIGLELASQVEKLLLNDKSTHNA